ncbi:MAG: UDP-N-acetylmuramate dehydrogenase [Legionellaceae bacterium]|nr:UDP-N-acetylmuramate dehydrogenase [Legionellaceae bacterium]
MSLTPGLSGLKLSNESLSKYTTWRIGGPADSLYKPAGIQDLILFLKQCDANEPLTWLGLGSNSLIRDRGVTGTVVLTQGCLNGLELVGDDLIRVEAGVSCAKMARFSARLGLHGGEFWAGIPGTMGGALRMNAGCFQGETWDSVVEVETITRTGEIRRRTPAEFAIAYRSVAGLELDEWFVAATCRLAFGEKEIALQRIKTLLSQRASTQPTSEYNCGSVFRNPPGDHAARLIESCGLKGFVNGGAKVSDKHANFIINHEGRASAHDIEGLILHVHTEILQQTGIDLVREVHIVGGV